METMREALERKLDLYHISEKPWSSYTEADYTPEQWHRACLIHQHEGDPTNKNDCKLPVRTPSGAVSRPGVHSAAAAVAGARGGVNASDEALAHAAKDLIRLYHSLNEDPPASLIKHADTPVRLVPVVEDTAPEAPEAPEEKSEFATLDEFIAHYGVKGMKWGQRRASREAPSSDAAKVGNIHSRVKSQKSTQMLSNKELRDAIERMNLEQQYSRMSGGIDKTRRQKTSAFVSNLVSSAGKQTAQQVVNTEAKRLVDDQVRKSRK